MTTAAPSAQLDKQGQSGSGTSWLSKVLAVNPQGPNWAAGVMLLDVLLVVLIVSLAVGEGNYFLSAVVGVLFIAVADPGGAYGHRASHNAVFALIGALVTALAFALGGSGWGWLVLAAFAITLVAGLAIRLGVHSFAAASFLSLWFIIALGQAVSLHQTHISSHTWAQVVAWVAGSGFWIAVTIGVWAVRGGRDMPTPVAELPADTARRKLSRPLILFAGIRAVALGGAVAIAFGFNLSHADWLPIAALVAMKPDLAQSTVAATQRVVGASIGAIVAGLLLLVPTAEHGLRLITVSRGLEIVAIVLIMHAIAVLFWNYAVYSATIAAAILILVDLFQPTDYSAEWDRVLWTLIGVAIGVAVMLLADQLAKRAKSRA